nr:MAG TPA: hypothetical protein [Caudoviricetes sp.]
MNFGNREITQAIVDILKSFYPKDMVIPYAISTTLKEEQYPSVTYFVQMLGTNRMKKDVNSFIKTVTDGVNTHTDTPDYITYQIQIDMWARKMSEVDYLQELYLDNVDSHLPVLTITGKDGNTTTQYMLPRDIGKNLDEQQRNDEKLYRRSYSYVIDVPNSSPTQRDYKQVNNVLVKHVWTKKIR